MLNDADETEDDGGFDPEAFARRQSHLADAPTVTIKQELPEPYQARQWVEAKDAPIKAAFIKARDALGPKPRTTSGPMGLGMKVKLAAWQVGWSSARLDMTKAQSAIFSSVDGALLELPGGRFHLQRRADVRQSLVVKDTEHLEAAKANLARAQAELAEADAPARQGRELALLNVGIGIKKVVADFKAETQRHERAQAKISAMPTRTASAKLAKQAAAEGEKERHEEKLANIANRLDALESQDKYLRGRLKLDYAGNAAD